MTALFGGLAIRLVEYAENTKSSKKSKALKMTILWEFDVGAWDAVLGTLPIHDLVP